MIEDEGPEAGHTFELTFRSRGSGGVGVGPRHDANWWSDERIVRVRAWSLPEALEKAAKLSLVDWKESKTARRWKETAWREGALWAAVECGAIADESHPWLAPGDNPYEETYDEENIND